MPRPHKSMHSASKLLFAIILAASPLPSPAQLTPALIPIPREFHPAAATTFRTLSVTVPAADPEDLFAASDLTQTLTLRGLTLTTSAPPETVNLLRAASPAALRALAASKLAFEPAMHDEGYILIATPGRVTIIAETAAGIFYGVQTLKQLIECTGGTAHLPTGTIRDWPAMRYRGVHDDLSRGPFPTLAYQKHQLDVFAAHKVNVYSPYFEHTLASTTTQPLAAPQGSRAHPP